MLFSSVPVALVAAVRRDVKDLNYFETPQTQHVWYIMLFVLIPMSFVNVVGLVNRILTSSVKCLMAHFCVLLVQVQTSS